MGCAPEMDRQRTLLGQAPPDEMVNQFCAAIYLEARDIEIHQFPALRQDLFMEQGKYILNCPDSIFTSIFLERNLSYFPDSFLYN